MMLCCSNPNLARHDPAGDRKPPLDRDHNPGSLPRVRPSRSRWSLFTSGESSRRRGSSRESSLDGRTPKGKSSSGSREPKLENSSGGRAPSVESISDEKTPRRNSSSDRRGCKRDSSSDGRTAKREKSSSERRPSPNRSNSSDSSPTRGSSSPPLRRLSRSPKRRERAASLPSARAAEAVALAELTAAITAEGQGDKTAGTARGSSQREKVHGRELEGGAILWSREKSSSAGALYRERSITRTGSTDGTGSHRRSSSSSPRRVGFTLETKGPGAHGMPEDGGAQTSGKTEQAMRPPRLEGMALAAPITVRDGDPCHVTVEVAGIPIPDITWFHGSREIKNCSDFRVDDKGTSCTLYIAAVTEELSTRGVRVVARNRVGIETKNVELKVYKVHSKWKPVVKSESFSTRSPDTFLRRKRGRRKVHTGSSVTSLNREPATKPSRSMSVGENWTYRHASHSSDSILDEVFSFDRKSAFATSTPRDVDPKNSQSQEIRQISPISHSSPAGTKEPRQKDVMTDSGFSENIFRYRSSETDDKHIEVGRVPPIALPEDFDIEPIISPKVEERLMSPREPQPLIYQQQSAVLETKPPTGRPTNTLPSDCRKFSANGQIWISEKKISKSLSAMQNVGTDPALGNKKYKLASQEKWESQEKVKRRSTGAQLEASPPVQQQQQKIEYETRQQQVDAFLRCDEPDIAVIQNNTSTNNVPNKKSTTPIIKRKTAAVPKRTRPVSETNLDDFVIPSTNNNSVTEKPLHEETMKEVSVASLSRPPQPLSPLPKDDSQLAKIQISGINATDAAAQSSTNNAELTQTPNLSGVDLTTEKDTSVALLGLTGKNSEPKRQTKGKDEVLSKAEILLSIEGPSFHPEIPKASSESKSEELSSVEVSQQLSKAAQVMATIEAGKINKKEPNRKMSPGSNDKGMQWVYPRSKQEGDSVVSISKSNINSNNSTKPSETSDLPCVKVLDDAISYIYAEAFAHFGDTADAVSTPLAQMAKKSSQNKDPKVVSQLLECPYVYKFNGLLPRLSEASDEDSLSSSQNNRDNFSNNNSTKSKYAPDLLNGINTNSNNRQEPNASSELDMDSADVIGLSDEIDVKSLRDQVEPSQPCTCPVDGWSSPMDPEHGSKPSSTDQHLVETSRNHTDPIIECTSNETICDNVDTSENIKICDSNPDIHSKNKENEENGMQASQEANTILDNIENGTKEEDTDSDSESVQTVIEVGEDQTINSVEDAEFDKNLIDCAHTLVDEVLKASIEVILTKEATLEGVIDAGTEPDTSTTPEDAVMDDVLASDTEPQTPNSPEDRQSSADDAIVTYEAQQQLDSEGTSVDEALIMNELSQVPVPEVDIEVVGKDTIESQPPTSAEDEQNHEDVPACVDVVIPVILDQTLTREPKSEVGESTTYPESPETQAETHNKPLVTELSEEELARIDSYVTEIISDAIAIFSKDAEPVQKIENESDISSADEGTTEGIPETDFKDVPRCEPLQVNDSFIQQVEAWVADVINEAVTIVANQKDTVKAMQGEADYTKSQQIDAESPNSSEVPVYTETVPYMQETHDIPLEYDTTLISPEVLTTQTESTEGESNHKITEVKTAPTPGDNVEQGPAEFFADEQPEDDDLEHIELNTSDLLQKSRNRTSSLSSISEEEEEEEEVSFVDETFQISDIPSTTYKPLEEEDSLVMDTFTQIDLPGHVGAEKALGYLDQNDQAPSVSPGPATGHQGLSGGQVVDDVCYTPALGPQHAQKADAVLASPTSYVDDSDTEGLIERQEAAIVCSTSQPLNLTPVTVSSDSEVLESSITDENTLDLSWDSDMGPELSFTAADRIAYGLRMANSEGRRDSETNTEPIPALVHAATDVVDVHEGVKDIGNRQDCDSELGQGDKTDLKKHTENDTELDRGDTTKSDKHTENDTELDQSGKTKKDLTGESTDGKAPSSDVIQGAAAEEKLVASSTLPPAPASAEDKETCDSPQSIGSSIRGMLTKNNLGAVLFLLMAVAAMVVLSWWESADV